MYIYEVIPYKIFIPVVTFATLLSSCADLADRKNNVDRDVRKPMYEMLSALDTIPVTGDFDQDYVKNILVLQACEIRMARNEVVRGNNVKYRLFADEITQRERSQEKYLEELLQDPEEKEKVVDSSYRHYELRNAAIKLSADLKKLQLSGDYDRDFRSLMILYYKTGIILADHALTHCITAFVKKVAETEKQEQTKSLEKLLSVEEKG